MDRRVATNETHEYSAGMQTVELRSVYRRESQATINFAPNTWGIDKFGHLRKLAVVEIISVLVQFHVFFG